MKNSNFRTSLTFLISLLIFLSPIKASDFGGYVIPTGNISTSCNKYSFKTIIYDDSEIESGHKDLSTLFPSGRSKIKKFLETQDKEYLIEAGKEVGIFAFPAILSMLISVLGVPGFVCFFFCKCCFNCLGLRKSNKKRKKKKKNKKKRQVDEELKKHLTEDNDDNFEWEEVDDTSTIRGAMIGANLRSEKGQCFIWYCSLLLVTLLVFVGSVWFYFFLKTVSGTGMTDCAFSHFFNDIRGGVKDDGVVFGGADGLKYLFGKLKGELGKAEKNQIPELELTKKSENLKTSVAQFYAKFKDSTLPSCSPDSPTKKVSPDSILMLTPNINEIVQQETELLESACNLIDFAGKLMNEMAGGQTTEYIKAIDHFDAQLTDFRVQITDFEDKTINTVDFNSNVNLIYQAIFFVIGGTMLILASFLVLMACSLKCGKCVGFSTSLQTVLALLKIFFSALVNITALAFIVNLCYFLKLGLDERKWAELIVGEDNMQYIDLCLYKTSSGNLTTLIPKDKSDELEELQLMIRGFDIDLSTLNYTDDEPPSMKYYQENGLEKWLNYEIPDFTQNMDDSPEKQVGIMNQILGCVNNEIEVDKVKCNFKPVSTLDDAVDFRNDQSYCIVPSFFNHKEIDQRYNTEATKCAKSAIPSYKSLKTCTDEHNELLKNMIASLSSMDQPTPKKQAVEIYNSLFKGVDMINEVRDTLKDTLEFVSSVETEGGLSALMNCTIVRREYKMLLGNTCYQFGINFAYQSLLLALLGPLLTMISFCICCSVIRSEENDQIRKQNNALYA